jgi:LmbE family N-acetylglucosaminyl deacetylase
MTKQAHAMVVTPHPDDAEFGAAGTVARWTHEGKEIIYVVCTNGDKGTSDINMKPEKLAKIREKEQLAAAKLLGVKEVVFLRYPDQTLEDTPEFRKEIVRQIRKYRPEIVITADPYRRYLWHRDHRIVSRVTMDAIFPYARDILSYPDLLEEGLQPHKVKEVLFWAAEKPNFCSNITETFDIKLAALHCHKSQVGKSFHDLEKRLRERCTAMAEGEEYKLAESFYRLEIWR